MSTITAPRTDRNWAATAVSDFLQDPRAYPERPPAVAVHETHISRVYVTDRYAYKLKKPLRFDFLDYSTLELRRAACEAEVRLNRRLAPHVYVGVVAVTADRRGRLKLGGSGTVVDWVVKMRRLDEDRSLRNRLADGTLTSRDIEPLAMRLANYYSQLPPIALRTDDYRGALLAHVTANEHELRRLYAGSDAVTVRRVHGAQSRLLRLVPQWFDDRVCDGRIVDGHGDLRPEHIFLDHDLAIIDCIEFNAEFRRLDVLDELGFLAMECESLGAADVGRQILNRYAAVSGDRWPPGLLAFYKAYRACVRAKVSGLRAGQLDGPASSRARLASRQYLELADRYVSEFSPPFVVVVYGLSGSGKSTLADELAREFDLTLLQTDALRGDVLPSSPALTDRSDVAVVARPRPPSGDGSYIDRSGQSPNLRDRYSPANRARVYDRLFDRADASLAQRLPVLLDGTFPTRDLRRQAVQLADRYRAPVLLLRCECPDDVAAQRIAARQATGESLSEATVEVRREQALELPGELTECTHAVDTTQSVPEMTAAVAEQLANLLLANSRD